MTLNNRNNNLKAFKSLSSSGLTKTFIRFNSSSPQDLVDQEIEYEIKAKKEDLSKLKSLRYLPNLESVTYKNHIQHLKSSSNVIASPHLFRDLENASYTLNDNKVKNLKNAILANKNMQYSTKRGGLFYFKNPRKFLAISKSNRWRNMNSNLFLPNNSLVYIKAVFWFLAQLVIYFKSIKFNNKVYNILTSYGRDPGYYPYDHIDEFDYLDLSRLFPAFKFPILIKVNGKMQKYTVVLEFLNFFKHEQGIYNLNDINQFYFFDKFDSDFIDLSTKYFSEYKEDNKIFISAYYLLNPEIDCLTKNDSEAAISNLFNRIKVLALKD